MLSFFGEPILPFTLPHFFIFGGHLGSIANARVSTNIVKLSKLKEVVCFSFELKIGL